MKRRVSACLCMVLALGIWAGCSQEARQTTPGATFAGCIILGRPTSTTMSASVTSKKDCEVYVSWGEQSGNYSGKSETLTITETAPAVLTMTGLAANLNYFYRLYFKENGNSDFRSTDEYSFCTPKTTGTDFNFVVQSDSHLKNKADPELYSQVMNKMAALHPDFMFDMGDTFLNDQESDAKSQSYADVAATVRQQLPYFDLVTRNVPLYYTIGNHEGEYGPWLDGTRDNLAAKSTLARTTYIPNPMPNDFYTGNAQKEDPLGYVQNYYAFTWGYALFVSIDPYRYGTAASDEKEDGWAWSLGKAQYDWFRKTLEESRAKFKFVFSHHAIGNIRGGAEIASLYEWGGNDPKGNYLFDQKRPGWGKPIQQIMQDTGVTVFFQGHDHLFAREMVDGVVYQTLPKPAEKIADQQSNFASYEDGDVLLNSGFLNVSVNRDHVQIDYIRNFFVSSGSQAENTGVVYSYAVDTEGDVKVLLSKSDIIENYGKNEESLNTEKQKESKDKRENKKTLDTAQDNSPVQIGLGAVSSANRVSVPADGFSFAIESDPHWDENTDNELLKSTFANIESDKPSFVIDLGDTSMAEKLASSESEIETRFANAKTFFELLGGLPLYSVLGNHDGESGENQQKQALVKPLRQQLFPFPPATNNFSGNITTADYYSFTKNNAQFIVLDPYSYTTEKVGQINNGWAASLGKAQYDWLINALEASKSEFKFVFIHNLVGGIGKDQRGGAEAADFFEWGGKNTNRVDEFAAMRQGWEMPIHDLLVQYGVDIVFHGHDHFYARQEKDGIIYQLVPQPGTPGNSVNSAAQYSYMNGTFLPSAGYIRVVVSSDKATVEYIKTGSNTIPDAYTITAKRAACLNP
jgi:phosphodiesterase/alkaline phosphatase D-like protein